MLFFKETAEEMVNRLIKQNTFPFLSSILKSRLIFHLKKFDDDNQKAIEEHPLAKEDDSFEEWFKNQREQLILKAYIKLAPVYTKTAPPPEPTHRQSQNKTCHLRLVANNG